MEDGGAVVGAGTTAVGVLNGAVEAAVAGTLRHDMHDDDAHGHLQVFEGRMCMCACCTFPICVLNPCCFGLQLGPGRVPPPNS